MSIQELLSGHALMASATLVRTASMIWLLDAGRANHLDDGESRLSCSGRAERWQLRVIIDNNCTLRRDEVGQVCRISGAVGGLSRHEQLSLVFQVWTRQCCDDGEKAVESNCIGKQCNMCITPGWSAKMRKAPVRSVALEPLNISRCGGRGGRRPWMGRNRYRTGV